MDAYQAGAGTSHNMNANEVIANLANVALGGKKGFRFEYERIRKIDGVRLLGIAFGVVMILVALLVMLIVARFALARLDTWQAGQYGRPIGCDANADGALNQAEQDTGDPVALLAVLGVEDGQTITVKDTTPPVKPTLADVTVGQCNGTPPAPTTITAPSSRIYTLSV